MVRRRTANTRKQTRRQSPKKGSRKTRTHQSLKEKILTTAIWGLSLLNVILIFSLISNFFKSPGEAAIDIGSVAPQKVAVPNEKITVQVLNSTDVQGLANQVAQYLRQQQFDVVDVGNYRGGFSLDQTLIFDRVSMNSENALKIARALQVDSKQVVPELEDSLQLMVTVIVGTDYKKLSLSANK